ncbi:hypothetical protein MARCHEWKA_01460 [Brevundimonas phage vB_BpoS-Marchewka]|uniref:Uncharacterized protein n=1 Tax=Brevundimonas phage vB_BpoS-Marchewka TaxID=2948604 RepID=A0A9E7N2H5_9CAUD|nr:hypothetical protein MARCHEWKA_01460 [Brevundimonas phage vB_BpoS-Marchewka]
MKLSTIPGLPALVILVTSHSGGLGASLHISEDAALRDVVRECQQDNDAPDDLEPTITAISRWIAEADIHYEFAVQPAALPGFRVVAFDHRTDTVLDNRIADTLDREAAEHFAGMIWNQQGFAQPDRDVSVFLYAIGRDEPLLTIREDHDTPEPTLDEARAAFNDDPTKETAATYRAAARRYQLAAMISAETLTEMLAETAAYV